MFFEKGVVSRRRNATFLNRGFEEAFCRDAWGSPGMLLKIRLGKKSCSLPARELTFLAEAENG